MRTSKYTFLSRINTPEDLRKLKVSELPMLCAEIRDYIISETAENPGHLGSSLGAVELAVAIHYVFDTPNDKLVWDVGHQAYAHKILTGRKEQFHTNRKYQGISGFPKMSESEYDAFGTGHSSTSISAVLGMAVAGKLSGDEKRNYIAVIGDGSIGGGMAFEALNHAAETQANILVILNDNKIAIDKNVGAVSRQLLNITSSPGYNRAKNRIWNFFSSRRPIHNKILRAFSKLGNAIKGTLLRGSNLFQSMGFRYFGPVDGHNVEYLVKVLRDLRTIPGARLLHAITVKGKGLHLAEKNQTVYHAPGKFDPDTGERIETPVAGQPPKYQDVFGETILELARQDERVVGITPAMATGCSLTIMAKELPDRVFDVGIAEQHAVTFAAGLAAQGMIPFCNIYSSFFQRAYDQVIHDVALQKLPVVFCLDRAGLVGEDGATHHGLFDLAFLRAVPNLVIASPMDEISLRNLMFTAYRHRELPFAIRYPRGRGVHAEWRLPMEEIPIGSAQLLREGSQVAVLSLGPLGNNAARALDLLHEQGIDATHVDMRFLAPLDTEMLSQIIEKHKVIVTIEDGIEQGGLFSAVSEFVSIRGSIPVVPIAIDRRFVEHGDIPSLYAESGFTPEQMADRIAKAAHADFFTATQNK
jgi:1-deoxy-D-xylulose-5-phosphate synthase